MRERHAGAKCTACADACPARALSFEGAALRIIAPACEGCGACAAACPRDALELPGAGWRGHAAVPSPGVRNAVAARVGPGRARPFPASEAFVPRRGSSFFGAGFARSGSRRASARAVPPRCGAKASRCGTHSSGISGRWPEPLGARLTSSLARACSRGRRRPPSSSGIVVRKSGPRPFRLKGLRSARPTNPRATCL